jgi:hypothetical protein
MQFLKRKLIYSARTLGKLIAYQNENNDTQFNGLNCDTQHNFLHCVLHFRYAEYSYSESCNFDCKPNAVSLKLFCSLTLC